MSLLHELGEAASQVVHAGEVHQEMDEEHGGAGIICGLNLCLLEQWSQLATMALLKLLFSGFSLLVGRRQLWQTSYANI